MDWTRRELKGRAKISLKANYWKSVLVAFILSIITGGMTFTSTGDSQEDYNFTADGLVDSLTGRVSSRAMAIIGLGLAIIGVAAVLVILVEIFVLAPLEVGCKKYFLDASEGNANLSDMGFCFRNGYMNVVAAQFLTSLFIFLWSLLLIIPGIVKAYSYRMIPYILAENPEMSFTEAKQLSCEMMNGQKWRTFVLDLSFILWALLSMITLNIVGILWVAPYMEFTNAELYRTLRPTTQTVYTAGDYTTGSNDTYGDYNI